MDTIDLPSSVYQPCEQDYGFWPDGIFPDIQAKTDTEQQPYLDCMDFSAYSDPLPISDLDGSATAWNEPQFPFAQDMVGTQPVQDEMRRHVISLVY
jgi:hypothetical protein